ncbi:MAG: hypothetical protein WC807_12580 [Hyphomicrobium sp.]|jgi:hypothetical protein
MAEVSTDLTYEVLKRLQDQGTRVQEDIRGIREEQSAIRGPANAAQSDVYEIYDRLDCADRRLERIERRLALNDEKV